MEIPVTVKGYDGKVRTFTVPAALKAGKDGKGATHWSKTE
jgi:outer membrane usher protein FimD/PapC